MRAILDLMQKDLLLLLRDRFGLFWILIFPLIYAFFFGAIFSGQGQGSGTIRIAIVDQDASEDSRRFVRALASHASLRVSKDDSGIVLTRSAESARDLVRRGKRAAYVMLKKGFGDQGLSFFGANPGSGGSELVAVGVDPARSAEKGYLQGILTELSFRHAIGNLTDRDRSKAEIAKLKKRIANDATVPKAQRLLLEVFFNALANFLGKIDMSGLDGGGFGASQLGFEEVTTAREGPKNAFEITFPSAILWGLIGCAAGFAIMIVRERSLGTMARLRTAPITLLQILAGKGAACFVACGASIVFMLVIAKF